MFIKILILFTLVPLAELYILIEAGRQIGIAPTIAMVLLTGFAGAYLARSQGFQLMQRIQGDLSEGRVPAAEMIDGAIILSGGLLLLTPGFCTDLFGFCLLTPLTRNYLKTWVQRWLDNKIKRGEINIYRH